MLKNNEKQQENSYLNSVNLNPKERCMKRGIGTLLFGATAFAGGIVAGLLLTPKSGKENRHWLEDKSRKLRKDGEMRIDQVSRGIRKTIKDTFPDLYAATEDLDFSEEEEIQEITKHG